MGSHPQIASFPDGKLVIAWDEAVQVNNKYYKRIGMQERSPAGINEAEGFLTTDTMNASYPVVTSLNDHVSLVAYAVKKVRKDYIMYQRVDLE